MRRGEVYWVDFPAPAGRRPAVFVSRSEAYAVRSRFSVVPLTRTIRAIPTEVRLGPTEGLPKSGVANADEIVTIPKQLLGAKIATLSRDKLAEIDDALRFALDLAPARGVGRWRR